MKFTLSFRSRILLSIFFAATICAAGAAVVSSIKAKEEGVRSLHEKSSAILSRLEATRTYVANQGMLEGVIKEVVAEYPSGELPKEVKLRVLKSVPIFASMKVGEMDADKEHYTFRIASNDPRNKDNAPTEREQKYLTLFESDPSITELADLNEESKTYSVMRPITLKKADGCLNCHGDPNTSPWNNGKDVLGYKMENWEDGKIHGMFAVVSELQPLYDNIRATQWYIAKWCIGILVSCLICIFSLTSAPNSQKLRQSILESFGT